MKAPVIFGLVSLGVLAFACAPRARGTESASRTVIGKRDPSPHIESVLAVNVNGKQDVVRFDFVVTNSGGSKAEVNFPSGQTHDVVVLDSLGREVWRWSRGRMFTQLLQNKILRTADSLSFDGRWTDARPGRYVAVARLASANYPLEQRTEFVVR